MTLRTGWQPTQSILGQSGPAIAPDGNRLSGSPSVNEGAANATIHSSYRQKGILIKSQTGAFHAAVQVLRSSPRSGQEN